MNREGWEGELLSRGCAACKLAIAIEQMNWRTNALCFILHMKHFPSMYILPCDSLESVKLQYSSKGSKCNFTIYHVILKLPESHNPCLDLEEHHPDLPHSV